MSNQTYFREKNVCRNIFYNKFVFTPIFLHSLNHKFCFFYTNFYAFLHQKVCFFTLICYTNIWRNGDIFYNQIVFTPFLYKILSFFTPNIFLFYTKFFAFFTPKIVVKLIFTPIFRFFYTILYQFTPILCNKNGVKNKILV